MAQRTAPRTLLSTLTLGLLLGVSGCGDFDSAYTGGNGSPWVGSSALFTARVSGSVGDGPIVNARLQVFSNSGELLMRTGSNGTADYDLTIRTAGRNFPLTIVADEGTDLVTNAAPDFSLVSVVMRPGEREIVNLNPFSTLVVEAAKHNGGISETTIAEATEAIVRRYGFGLDTDLVPDPLFSEIDESNVHVIVKASEALGEMIRRTRDALTTSGTYVDGNAVMNALAADLADGWIDGQGADGTDPRIAAVAHVASAAVMVEAMANRLHVYGADATAAMDRAILQVRPDAPASSSTRNVPISPEALVQTRRALRTAAEVAGDPRILEAVGVLEAVPPGATEVRDLPRRIEDPLNNAILNTAYVVDDAQLRELNSIGSGLERGHSDGVDGDAGQPGQQLPRPGGGDSGADGNTVNDTGDTTQSALWTNRRWSFREVGSGGGSATQTPSPNAAPTISGTPTTTLVVGDPWSFTPTASDPDGDALTFSVQGRPVWASFDTRTGRLSGTPTAAGSYGPITISVSDGTATAALGAFTLRVDTPTLGTATVSWQPPTQRIDGSALTDLVGYRVYYGKSASALTHVINIGNAGQTSQHIANLDAGTWYFAVTAYCSKGLESPKSEIGSKRIM